MKIRCYICNSSNIVKSFVSSNIHGPYIFDEKDTFQIYRCKRCENVFIGNIKIDSNYYKKYYRDDYYVVDLGSRFRNSVVKVFDYVSFRFKNWMISSRIDKSRKNSILDIGCGPGNFLDRFSNKEFEKWGVEINKKGAKEARKKGIRVFDDDILKFNLNKKFDVITMWHVLEHINNPDQVIKKVRKMLNNRGLFICAVPNSDSLGFKLGKKYWYHLDSPRHLFIPNKKNLKYLFKKNKLKIEKIKYEFYDYPLDLFYSLKNSYMKFVLYPLYPFIKPFNPETLTIIARKK